jgi:hypothetical protein
MPSQDQGQFLGLGGSSRCKSRLSSNSSKATGIGPEVPNPVALSARGSTRDQALEKLREKISIRLNKGTELVALEIDARPHPWMEFAGMFKDDPWIDDWVQSMEDYRKRIEDDPNR